MKPIHIRFILFIISALYLTSCRNKKDDFSNIFRYNQIGGLESLDPAFAKNLSIMWQINQLYNTLITVDSQLNLQPSLAKSWIIHPDQRITFIIRDDVYFHDHAIFPNGKGRKMTAHDVVYSFNRLIDPQTASSGAWIFNDRVAKENPFEAVNDTTFSIRLQQSFQPILYLLTMPYCAIVPHEAITAFGKDFRSNPIGTGPFKFVRWDENNFLLLHKNAHYWEQDNNGNSLPYLDGISVSFNETRAMEFLLLQQQKIDFINGIDGSVKDLVLNKKGELKPEFLSKIQMQKAPYLNTEYLGILQNKQLYPNENHPLRNPKVRAAIQYAINRQKIVTYFRNGIGIPADYGFIPKGLQGSNYTDSLGKYHYNPQKAAELLADAGYPNGKGIEPILLSTPESSADVCNYIATELNNIGISVKVDVMQPGILRQLMSKGDISFFKAQWIADYPDAETYLSFFLSTLPAPPNYTQYNNPKFDALYHQSISTINIQSRNQLYCEMDSLIMQEGVVIPLFYDEILHFMQPNITGLSVNQMNIIDLKRVKKSENK